MFQRCACRFRGLGLLFLLAGLAACQSPAPSASQQNDAMPDTAQMRTYYMAMLYRDTVWKPEKGPSLDSIQQGHLLNISRLAQEGSLLLAGPFLDSTQLRGIFVLKAGSAGEAQRLIADDPAIKAGRLRAEIKPWYGPRKLETIKW